MKTVALIVGLVAVSFFLLSYLQKKRANIVVFNLTSRVLYVVQYLLLGAFEGAVLDVIGAISAFLAQQNENAFIKKHKKIIFIVTNLCIIIAGVLLYKNIFSLFPMIGILLQSGALWLKEEKHIRIVSMLGCPFWFAYNFASTAYGSCIGDVLAFASLMTSFIRYNVINKEE